MDGWGKGDDGMGLKMDGWGEEVEGQWNGHEMQFAAILLSMM